jgi:hypothetical protein
MSVLIDNWKIPLVVFNILQNIVGINAKQLPYKRNGIFIFPFSHKCPNYPPVTPRDLGQSNQVLVTWVVIDKTKIYVTACGDDLKCSCYAIIAIHFTAFEINARHEK